MLIGLLPFAGVLDAKERERGLLRLVPTPFKKEDKAPAPPASEAQQAVEDMRQFTAGLPGQVTQPSQSVKPQPAVPPEQLSVVPPPQAATPRPAEVAKPERKKLLRLPSLDLGKDRIKEPTAKKERRKWIKLPFAGDRNEEEELPVPGPSSVTAPEVPVPAAPSSADAPRVVASPAPTESDNRKGLRKFSIPRIGGKSEEPVAAAGDPELAAGVTAVTGQEKKSKWLRLPFAGSRDKGDEEVSAAPELAAGSAAKPGTPDPVAEAAPAEAGAPKKKSGGFLTRLSRGSLGKKGDTKAADAPQKPRDLGTGEKYIVTVDSTPFYTIGPAQPMPPDEILTEGRVVTMRKAGWGWSDIELTGGQMGVVATKNLRKATAAEVGGRYASRRGSSRGLWKVFDYNPAPEPELPSDSGGIPLGAGLLPPLDPND